MVFTYAKSTMEALEQGIIQTKMEAVSDFGRLIWA